MKICEGCIHAKVCSLKILSGGKEFLKNCAYRRCKEETIPELKTEVEYPAGFWEPELGESYITDSSVYTWENDDIDQRTLAFGVTFKSEEERDNAMIQRSAYCELVRVIAEENHAVGWKANWTDNEQMKCYFIFSHTARRGLMIENSYWTRSNHSREYFAVECQEKIIERLGEEKIRLAFGIEDKQCYPK